MNIVDPHIAAYLDSLSGGLPEPLDELERRSVQDGVPIIRKAAQELLSLLLTTRKPKRILEVGTAVGFSCLFMNQYLPPDGRIVTIEKVAMRIEPAKENLAAAKDCERIILLVGEAMDILKTLAGETEEAGAFAEIFIPKINSSFFSGEPAFAEQLAELAGTYDFIFMDAAKGQYLNFLPYCLKLLAEDGMFVTDNVLQEGSIADSKFSIPRRERTIHMRMREYLFTLTHRTDLKTAVLPVGDGMALTIKRSLQAENESTK